MGSRSMHRQLDRSSRPVVARNDVHGPAGAAKDLRDHANPSNARRLNSKHRRATWTKWTCSRLLTGRAACAQPFLAVREPSTHSPIGIGARRDRMRQKSHNQDLHLQVCRAGGSQDKPASGALQKTGGRLCLSGLARFEHWPATGPMQSGALAGHISPLLHGAVPRRRCGARPD